MKQQQTGKFIQSVGESTVKIINFLFLTKQNLYCKTLKHKSKWTKLNP